MKKIIFIIVIMFPLFLFAQKQYKKDTLLSESSNIPINISYYGNLVIHPGIKVG